MSVNILYNAVSSSQTISPLDGFKYASAFFDYQITDDQRNLR